MNYFFESIAVKKHCYHRVGGPEVLQGGSYDVHGYAYFLQSGFRKNSSRCKKVGVPLKLPSAHVCKKGITGKASF